MVIHGGIIKNNQLTLLLLCFTFILKTGVSFYSVHRRLSLGKIHRRRKGNKEKIDHELIIFSLFLHVLYKESNKIAKEIKSIALWH